LICANIAALTEVVYGKINFIEPGNHHDIAEKMIKFYNWEFSKISKKEFLWKNNINQTIECYKQILWL
jgi:hypothetical protein